MPSRRSGEIDHPEVTVEFHFIFGDGILNGMVEIIALIILHNSKSDVAVARGEGFVGVNEDGNSEVCHWRHLGGFSFVGGLDKTVKASEDHFVYLPTIFEAPALMSWLMSTLLVRADSIIAYTRSTGLAQGHVGQLRSF